MWKGGKREERRKGGGAGRKKKKFFPLDLDIICLSTAVCVYCDLFGTISLFHTNFSLFSLYVCTLVFLSPSRTVTKHFRSFLCTNSLSAKPSLKPRYLGSQSWILPPSPPCLLNRRSVNLERLWIFWKFPYHWRFRKSVRIPSVPFSY